MACAVSAAGQQISFIPLIGPHAPQGSSILLKDSVRGGLWLGGATDAGEGLTYFDGIQFISPLKEPFPKTEITGMAEDAEGGVWLATYIGIFRVFRGHLEHVVSGVALTGIVRVGPGLLLVAVTDEAVRNTQLMRIARARNGNWRVDSLLDTTPGTRFQPDGAGHILFACPGGYCEFAVSDIADWQARGAFPVIRHAVRQFGDFKETLILRDRFGCVWQRGRSSAYESGTLTYQCPEDVRIDGPRKTHPLMDDLVGPGPFVLVELDDGSIVVPSFGKLAIGRPGRFRVYTALQGYPGAVGFAVTGNGIWMSNGNGLFVMPRHERIEFWTEREGLDGNTWSIVRTASKTLAVAGQTLRVLNADRTRWDSLPSMPNLWHLSVGLNGRIVANTATGQALRLSSEGKRVGRVHSVETDLPIEANASYLSGKLRGCWDVSGILGTAGVPALLSEMCVSFVKGGKSKMWRATQGGGFTLTEQVDGSPPKISSYSGGGEVGIGTVRFFGVDRRGWIWRGSPVGAYVADFEQAREGHWLYLNHLDGIAGTDANTGSFFSDPDGSVWFGADNSINHIRPVADLVHPKEAPAIFISSFSLDGGDAQMADMVRKIKSHTRVTAHIGLRDFYHPNALRFRYRVAPDDSAWREAKTADLELGICPLVPTPSKCKDGFSAVRGRERSAAASPCCRRCGPRRPFWRFMQSGEWRSGRHGSGCGESDCGKSSC